MASSARTACLLVTAALAAACSGGELQQTLRDAESDASDAQPDAQSDGSIPCPAGCRPDEICRNGECTTPSELCREVSCPIGEQCYLGICIEGDPCDAVVCPNPGDICQFGECIAGEADSDGDGVVARDDCNDQDAEIYPGASERCNGLDDDCDEAVDETFDADGDGFPGCEETPDSIRDCDDEDVWIQPGAAERCNGLDDDCDLEVDEGDPGGGDVCGTSTGACETGVTRCVEGTIQCIGAINPGTEVCNGTDDDCNGTIDDGSAVESCDQVDHGRVECVDGHCDLTACDDGWIDLDDDMSDGCEVEVDDNANSCANATALGSLQDNGARVDATGTIAPEGDVDWFSLEAIDGYDGTCDSFDLRIFFVTNPGGSYAFEVRRGGCAQPAECGNVTLESYDFYTNFYDDGAWGTEVRGECPCSAVASVNANICTNNGDVYRLRVYRPDGQASGDFYTLRITNGT